MDKQKRIAEIERALLIELLRKDHTLSAGKIDYLLDAARSTIEYQSALSGEAIRGEDLASATCNSDVGQMIFSPREADAPAMPDMTGWSPAKRMAWSYANEG